MSNKENGGAAFPCEYEGTTRSDAFGMTLRDYFAAKAMQGLISNSANQADYETFAVHAYGMADAMLKERQK